MILRASYFFILLMACYAGSYAQISVLNYLYKPGDNGYACFRIPALIKTSNGTLLAFAEGRKKHCGDAEDIDLVLRRSEDGGKSWSALMVVWDDDGNTCGNPAPVMDEETGKIILLSTWNQGSDHESQIIQEVSKDTRRIFVLTSSDDGFNWSKPREITADVKLPNWTWYATGPCNGIQIRNGKYKGRLVIPCDHIEAGTKKYFSHAVYSDDGGENWKLGGTTPTDQVNECTIAELKNGVLLLNMRNYNQVRFRQTSTSSDGGMSWKKLIQDTSLPEPVCQASMIRLWNDRKKPVLVFSNPASHKKRENMTIRWSYDQGKSWRFSQLIHAGPAAYSNLVELTTGKIGLLFEGGIKSAYEGIAWMEVEYPVHQKKQNGFQDF
ncbi:MAG: exo-alpha-sialidase [Chitinophagia bacterium]|jgi:sialidase-1